jgi:hypothetical protein
MEIVDYSEKSIALFGDSKMIKDILKNISGSRYNPNLKKDGVKTSGWIFPKDKKNDLEELINLIQKITKKEEKKEEKNEEKKEDKKEEKKEYNLEIVDYTEKSIVLFGNSFHLKDEIKKISGARYNANLKKDGVKTPGWLFPKDKKEEVEKLIQ